MSLIKSHISVSTNMSNNGEIDTTKVFKEKDFIKLKNDLKSNNKQASTKIFEYLYDIGYLEARLSFMYECDESGYVKENNK